MADAKEKLILLARQMVLCQSMPQIESWNWPRSATQRLRRQAMQAEEAAGEQCRRWAMAIKEIADALPKQQPAQNDAPCGTEKCPPGMVCKSPFCRAEQPAQGEAVDKGPWRAVAEHNNPVTGVWIESDDFAHDVRLYVNGDFADQGQRLAYAKRIADCLTNDWDEGWMQGWDDCRAGTPTPNRIR